MRTLLTLLAACAGLAVSGCGSDNGAAVDVVLIGDAGKAQSDDMPLEQAAAILRAATHEGLVSFDAEGRISPGLAESWIVTDDGLSYIFRLREMGDAEGEAILASDVRKALDERIARQDGQALGLDLGLIEAIHARTRRVIEVRLTQPVPEFLNLLAGPELALDTEGQPDAMRIEADGDAFSLLPPMVAADNMTSPWLGAEALEIRIDPPKQAVDLFQSGGAQILLGGGIDALPHVQKGGLLRGAIRLDPVLGLFGLGVARHEVGFLSNPENREAVAMAINRGELIEPFNVGGWVPTTHIVPTALPDSRAPTDRRWSGLSMEERQNVARARVQAWISANDAIPALTIDLPPGRGGDVLLAQLQRDLAAIGLSLERAGEADESDFWLIDEVARYRMARWYLNRLNCSVTRAACSEEGDAFVRAANTEADDARRRALMAQAERLIEEAGGYIPLGPPIRFSLVRGSIDRFAVNPLGVHPLSQLALDPT
ncbi:ABC transporter substrate-binding protein [Croceicoccus mobilis]|uniref:Diguanylate cyclase n=1 Tax=Croceicoccus mobilis TaxID=1703339 RepID=A0A916YRQ3_9SPHN|nr:ABC transporter substrate-binding protein [Croceicoccus mobilis]GGD57814.1 diguanylate cyclase [Croceicoccus mobilis]